MTSMIERVARAICESSNSYEYERTGMVPSPFYDYASAAIQAMRPDSDDTIDKWIITEWVNSALNETE